MPTAADRPATTACPSCGAAYEDVRSVAQLNERARIVAWLRKQEEAANTKLNEAGAYPDWFEHERDIFWSAAEAIERGDHAS
jgi:hypothetical protein